MLDEGGGQSDCVLTANVGREESVIEPADYLRWRDSRLGSLTESIEQRAILGLCGNLSGLRVLDLGCGDVNYALRASAEGAFAVGLDISPAMLRAVRARGAAQSTQVRWCQASIAALPFAAKAFDVVIAVTILCFNAEPSAAIKEVARVLRPGGSLVIGELGKYSLWALSRTVRGWLGSRTYGMYRWHIVDPIRFEKDLKVTIQALGWRSGGRYLPLQDDIASTAFWYQTEPHAPFPKLPTKDELEIN